ncbi:MAG: S1C family serine protease [Acidimicrobiales bacterium]
MAALLAALVAAPSASATTALLLRDPGRTAPAGGIDVQAVLRTVAPSVVTIETGRAGADRIFGSGAGSGVVLSRNGLVLTNAHVVAGADAIRVAVAGGPPRPADLVGSSPSVDIALVRVRDASGLVPATLGSSGEVAVGDDVVAIGNALSLGDAPTVTRGIVSAKGRSLEADGIVLADLLQIDAAINRGNSGGPLVNSAGQVIGINTAGIPNAQNLGFAIEIDAVRPVVEQLLAGWGELEVRGFLGVTTRAVSELPREARDGLRTAATTGLVVLRVQPGSGAADVDLRVGDVMLAIDGRSVETPTDLGDLLRTRSAGDRVTVDIDRQGERRSVTATLGSRVVPAGR